jgi:fumarylacetoacetate (FAA) hydrolase
MLEKISTGEFVTPYMNVGDTVRIEVLDEHGSSIFGTIEQKIVAP